MRILRIFSALLALVVSLTLAAPARASSSTDLVRLAQGNEAAHEDDIAIRRYTEAIALDPTYGDAYMGLGLLRARRGDMREADRVFTVALSHLPQLRPALAGRARARWALRHREEACQDLEAFLAYDPDIVTLRELAGWYGEDGRVPAQLAIWRRLLSQATRSSDAALTRDAKNMVRALQILVAPADPVVAPQDGGELRRIIANVARRGG